MAMYIEMETATSAQIPTPADNEKMNVFFDVTTGKLSCKMPNGTTERLDWGLAMENIALAGNPNCPISKVGDIYRVTTPGRFGGAAGRMCQTDDLIRCIIAVDTAADYATVGDHFYINELCTMTIDIAIVAFPTGGAANATLLEAEMNGVVTCATDHDSVILPASNSTADIGKTIIVRNNGAALLDVFCDGADTIDGLGVVDVIHPGVTRTYTRVSVVGFALGRWYRHYNTVQANIITDSISENTAGNGVHILNDTVREANITTTTVVPQVAQAQYNRRVVVMEHIFAGGAITEVIPVNIPIGAKLLGAAIEVNEDIVIGGGGVTWAATWTASTQVIGAGGQLLPINTKVNAVYDSFLVSAIVAGAPETITLTANAGTFTSGRVIVMAVYEEIVDFNNV